MQSSSLAQKEKEKKGGRKQKAKAKVQVQRVQILGVLRVCSRVALLRHKLAGECTSMRHYVLRFLLVDYGTAAAAAARLLQDGSTKRLLKLGIV